MDRCVIWIGLLALWWGAMGACHQAEWPSDPPSLIWIDADTGNEMDDLYAIVRTLKDQKYRVLGLSSAHFQNAFLLSDSLWHREPVPELNTQALSQRLNEALLKGMARGDLPHPPGSDRPLGYAWGFYEGAPIPDNPASEAMIRCLDSLAEEERLAVFCLGPATTLAVALLKRPDLVSKVQGYLLSMQYTAATGVWDKNEFNARNDLNALDLLLAWEGLDLRIVPASAAGALVLQRGRTQAKLATISESWASQLSERWDQVGADDTWIMWDLALAESALEPRLVKWEKRSAPPENGARPLWVCVEIDASSMEEDFWSRLTP
ncbi:MAG: nucleoside hydrolase [Bacteroidota bacterium]